MVVEIDNELVYVCSWDKNFTVQSKVDYIYSGNYIYSFT